MISNSQVLRYLFLKEFKAIIYAEVGSNELIALVASLHTGSVEVIEKGKLIEVMRQNHLPSPSLWREKTHMDSIFDED